MSGYEFLIVLSAISVIILANNARAQPNARKSDELPTGVGVTDRNDLECTKKGEKTCL